MNITQLTLDKIEQLGLKEAAVFFGKSEVTVRAWKQKGKVPAEAAQLVLDSMNKNDPEPPRDITIPDMSSQTVKMDTMERLALIETRLARLEFKVESPTHTAVVPPQKQPNWTDPHRFGK